MDNTPFTNLPLNTLKAYVKGTSNGCDIYIPCANDNTKFMNIKRDGLQKWLNNQLQPPAPIEPQIA